MLHYETIEPRLLELLIKLQASEEFSQLRLVGGTSLALQYGHRKSVDIDLFGLLEIGMEDIAKRIAGFGNSIQLKRSETINIFIIDGIKVDIVNYPFPWLSSVLEEDGLMLARPEDIAAMKISAITGRGTRKDFIDLFELLKYFSMNEILSFYLKKYQDGSAYLALKSMSYFQDAEQNPMPTMFSSTSWEEVKQKIEQEVQGFLK